MPSLKMNNVEFLDESYVAKAGVLGVSISEDFVILHAWFIGLETGNNTSVCQTYAHVNDSYCSTANSYHSFVHSFISGMHHYECIAPNVDIILQSGRF